MKEYSKGQLKEAVKIWIAAEQDKALYLALVKAKSLERLGNPYAEVEIPDLIRKLKILKVGYRKRRQNQVKAYLSDGLTLVKAVFEVGGPSGEVLVPLGIKFC